MPKKGANPFERSTVKVEKRSPFDMSHSNYLTMKVGTLTPILTEKVMPGDTISLGMNFRASLPPLASNFFGRVRVRVNAFFVPMRLLYGAWKDYLLYSQNQNVGFIPEGTQKYYIPTLRASSDNYAQFGPGTLADYLGLRGGLDVLSGTGYTISLDLLPFEAYHRIWRDWYRVPAIQRDPLNNSITSTTAPDVKNLHKSGITSTTPILPGDVSGSPQYYSFADNVRITDLRQVNYDKDYFTTAFRNQAGGAAPMSVSVSLPKDFRLVNAKTGNASVVNNPELGENYMILDSEGVPVSGSALWSFSPGSTFQGQTFTIPQLRTANALQRFAEDNALAGGRYKDTILANYGVTPADALADVPIYLGGFEEDIYKNTVLATANSDAGSNVGFGDVVGGSAASAYSSASNSLIDKFSVSEHGFLMVLADIMPDSVYASGCRRYLQNIAGYSAVDYLCWPKLANAGNQIINKFELANDVNAIANPTTNAFGYTDRYADMKFHIDEVHGLFTYGEDLDFMSIQRVFENPQISTDFLEVPTTALDNVTAVTGALSNYGVQMDCGFSMKMIRPLPVYSIPSLCDDIHKDTVSVPRGGRRV